MPPTSLTCHGCQAVVQLNEINGQDPIICPKCGLSLHVPAVQRAAEGKWYYARGKTKIGPLNWKQLQELAQNDGLHPTAEPCLLARQEPRPPRRAVAVGSEQVRWSRARPAAA
jgi:hypothetical protein